MLHSLYKHLVCQKKIQYQVIDHTGGHDFLRYISKEMIPNDLNHWDGLHGGNSPVILLPSNILDSCWDKDCVPSL